MANTLTNVLHTILARGLPVLRKYAVMPRLVNTDYSMDAARPGQSINIPIPSSLSATAVTASNTLISPSNLSPDTVAINLNKHYHAAIHLTDKDMNDVLGSEHLIPMGLEEAMRALAEQINSDILATYKGVYGYVGTAGTTPFASTVAAATDARKILANQKCPLGDRRMVLDPDAEANALALAAFSNFEQTGDQNVKIEGQLGRKFGFDIFCDQQIPTHTQGTLSDGNSDNALVNGALTAGDTTMDIDAATLTGTLVAGDVFVFAGHSQTYTVVTGGTASGNALAGVVFEPPLVTDVADDTEITLKASHVVNLAFNRNAFAFAARPIQDAVGQLIEPNKQAIMVDPVTGIPFRLEFIREYKQTVLDLDVLYGCALIRPELACRIAG
jgi:hypothetical protein